MNDSTYILLAIPLVTGVLLMSACDDCGKTGYDSDAAPPPSATPSTTASAVPPPAIRWAVVETMGSVEDRWGAPPDAEGAWGAIEKGTSPYPWRVTFAVSEEDPEYDCGTYEQLTDDWRVAYCKGGGMEGGRRAMRLTLHVKPGPNEQLRIQLSESQVNLILGRQ